MCLVPRSSASAINLHYNNRIVISYPISVVLALFCNVLLNPETESAVSDVSNLHGAHREMEAIFLRYPVIEAHLDQVKKVIAFVEK